MPGLSEGLQVSIYKLVDLVYDLRVVGVDVVVYNPTSVTNKKRSAWLTMSIHKDSKVGTPNGGVATLNKSEVGSASGNYGGGFTGDGVSGAGACGSKSQDFVVLYSRFFFQFFLKHAFPVPILSFVVNAHSVRFRCFLFSFHSFN